jgi:diaminohydroxyphosphoribosylaminopyrimidine deaminase/5-amino-6-(5-phosphoribosylamino)uracil reductase
MNIGRDEKFMREAIRLAWLGQFSTHPNPCVGSVIVKNGEIIGSGYHVKAGLEHAEINALNQAGSESKGSVVYVTLEPCSFHGRTPSCAQALIEAGVGRVVVAAIDPDPRNSGKGIAILQGAGIEVVTHLLEGNALKLIEGHVQRFIHERPFVRLKLAMSLDGKTALSNGKSKWITSKEARADVQKYRAMSGAIVSGVETIIKDDPDLSVRLETQDVPNAEESNELDRPTYVIDSKLRTPPSSRVLGRTSTVLVAAQAVRKDLKFDHEVLCFGEESGKVDLAAFLRELARREHSYVLFESGATLAGALVEEKLVDELILYIAPKLLGSSAKSLLKLPELDRISDSTRFEVKDVQKIGEDIRVILSPMNRRFANGKNN